MSPLASLSQVAMAPRPFVALLLLLCAAAAFVLAADAAGTADGSEEWGYVQVRPSKLSIPIYYL